MAKGSHRIMDKSLEGWAHCVNVVQTQVGCPGRCPGKNGPSTQMEPARPPPPTLRSFQTESNLLFVTYP